MAKLPFPSHFLDFKKLKNFSFARNSPVQIHCLVVSWFLSVFGAKARERKSDDPVAFLHTKHTQRCTCAIAFFISGTSCSARIYTCRCQLYGPRSPAARRSRADPPVLAAFIKTLSVHGDSEQPRRTVYRIQWTALSSLLALAWGGGDFFSHVREPVHTVYLRRSFIIVRNTRTAKKQKTKKNQAKIISLYLYTLMRFLCSAFSQTEIPRYFENFSTALRVWTAWRRMSEPLSISF